MIAGMKRREFITLVGGAIAAVILITAWLVVWPGWLRSAQAQSWMSEESGRVRHIVVTLNKSRTLRFDKPFASAVVGAPDIMDATSNKPSPTRPVPRRFSSRTS
jgi:hypothetical protein